MKEFILQLIRQHQEVLKQLKKQYVLLGGDPADPEKCPDGQIRDPRTGECIDDPGVGEKKPK